MRHVDTVIAAIVIAPVAWITLAFGQEHWAQLFAGAHGDSVAHPGDFIQPLLLLAGVGILIGFLATLRFSPAGAVLTGAVYTASYVALLIKPAWLPDRLDRTLSIAGRHADLATPVRTGTTAVLGALLLVAVVSVGRWRRWPQSVDDEPDNAPGLHRQHKGLGLTDGQEPTTDYVGGPERAASPAAARR